MLEKYYDNVSNKFKVNGEKELSSYLFRELHSFLSQMEFMFFSLQNYKNNYNNTIMKGFLNFNEDIWECYRNLNQSNLNQLKIIPSQLKIKFSFEKKEKEYKQDSFYLDKWDSKELDNEECEKVHVDIDKNKPFSKTILGEFDYKSNTITLYINSIVEQYNNEYETDIKLISVFIHEAFHAYHFYMTKLKNIVKWNINYQLANIVIESLASYVEIIYLRNNNVLGFNLFDEKIDDLKKHNMHIYPYSGAIYIDNMSNPMIFYKIFKDSLLNWDDAYDDIVACKQKNQL